MKSKTRKIYLIGLSFGLLVIGLMLLPIGTIFNKTASAQVQKDVERSDSSESFERNNRFDLLNKIIRNPNQDHLMTTVINEIQEVTSSDGAAADDFGYSVSIDGDRAVIGAFQDDDAGSGSGSAYVFSRSGATWAEQTKLTASDAATSYQFGRSVAISGNTVIVGSHLDYSLVSGGGSAYIFTPGGQQAKLVASDTAQLDNFGSSVAIDGDTAVVGSVGDDDLGKVNNGSVYVFTRSGGVWTEQAKLLASDADNDDGFGTSVSIDGNTIVVGQHKEGFDAGVTGAAYVFTRSVGVWTEQAKLTAFDEALGDFYGRGVSISGNTIAVGSNQDEETPVPPNIGSVYVYKRTGIIWNLEQKLNASDAAANEAFGRSVSIDGDTLAVGASFGDNGAISGKAYVFRRNGSTWTEYRKLLPSVPETDFSQFSFSVSVSGATVISGNYLKDVLAPLSSKDTNKTSNLAGANQGSAYFYNLLAPTAANVSISGRVLTLNGRGIPSSFVNFTDADGNIRTAGTNQFGYFRFDNVEVGQTYVFQVSAKGYLFAPQVINVDYSISGLNFSPISKGQIQTGTNANADNLQRTKMK